jgi:hypothetical protein
MVDNDTATIFCGIEVWDRSVVYEWGCEIRVDRQINTPYFYILYALLYAALYVCYALLYLFILLYSGI